MDVEICTEPGKMIPSCAKLTMGELRVWINRSGCKAQGIRDSYNYHGHPKPSCVNSNTAPRDGELYVSLFLRSTASSFSMRPRYNFNTSRRTPIQITKHSSR